MDMKKGNIFNIQRFSLHDGPGIRTTVFLKGCPNHCPWCHNPEGLLATGNVMLDKKKCIGCLACIQVCPTSAIQGNMELCNRCFACVKACPVGALERAGKEMTAREVFNIIIEDLYEYKNTGGGVTLSGGEPLMQLEFCVDLCQMMKEAKIHVALETSGIYGWNVLNSLLPYIDLVILDIKHMDNNIHRDVIGTSNELVLDVINQLSKTEKCVQYRTTIIPGFNDSVEAIQSIARYLSSFGRNLSYRLVPFHQFGKEKYEKLYMEYSYKDIKPLSKQQMVVFSDAAKEYLKDVAIL